MSHKRNYNWQHNALLGHASCFGTHLKIIQQAPSATAKAKNLAEEILLLQHELYAELKQRRVEPDGSIWENPKCK